MKEGEALPLLPKLRSELLLLLKSMNVEAFSDLEGGELEVQWKTHSRNLAIILNTDKQGQTILRLISVPANEARNSLAYDTITVNNIRSCGVSKKSPIEFQLDLHVGQAVGSSNSPSNNFKLVLRLRPAEGSVNLVI